MPESDPIAGADVVPSLVCACVKAGLDAAWVQVAGELDVATAAQLERTLRHAEQQARLVVVDLRELTFMDCVGVHRLVDASARARERGDRLVLLRGRPTIDRLFTLTGTAADVELSDTESAEPPVRAALELADAGRGHERPRDLAPPFA